VYRTVIFKGYKTINHSGDIALDTVVLQCPATVISGIFFSVCP